MWSQGSGNLYITYELVERPRFNLIRRANCPPFSSPYTLNIEFTGLIKKMYLDKLKKVEFYGMDMIYQPSFNCSRKQIEKFLSQFSFLYVAKSICELAKNLLQKNINTYEGISYGNETLCKAFYLAIKYASNSIQNENKIPSKNDIKIILLIAAGEIDKSFNIIVSSNQQICENYANQIARTWCIFHKLWPLYYEDNPLEFIENEVNVPYILILGFSWSIVQNGYTLECKEYKGFEQQLGISINKKWCENYLNYFSCSRNMWISKSCPPTYISKPILDSGEIPTGKESKVYFIPSAKNLISRVTTGLFYDLSDKYNKKAGHGNTFKSQFGKIFEQYVRHLFEFHLGSSFLISGDIEYGKKTNRRKTTDFLIRHNDSLILIEVKQASLYAKSLYEGNENDIIKDLKRNIGEAVDELNKTEKALNEGYEELKAFWGCNKIFKLIVLNNSLHLANNFCKDLLKNEVDLSNTSIINIYELEILLDIQQATQNIFEMIEEKVNSYPNHSFKDFIARAYPKAEKTGKFINKYLEEVFSVIKNINN